MEAREGFLGGVTRWKGWGRRGAAPQGASWGGRVVAPQEAGVVSQPHGHLRGAQSIGRAPSPSLSTHTTSIKPSEGANPPPPPKCSSSRLPLFSSLPLFRMRFLPSQVPRINIYV